MDDKFFFFVLLIPGFIFTGSYYFMKSAKKGKTTFVILTVILVILNILYRIKLDAESHSEFNFKSGIEWLVFFYAELIFLFLFALVYGFVSLRRRK